MGLHAADICVLAFYLSLSLVNQQMYQNIPSVLSGQSSGTKSSVLTSVVLTSVPAFWVAKVSITSTPVSLLLDWQ